MSEQQHYQQDPNDFLLGGGVKSASFLKIGDSVTGIICEPPKMQQQRDMQTNEPKVWQDGSPMMQLVVTLQTDERDNNTEQEDDGRRRVYIKFNMKNAVADAVRKAGAKALEVGGKLTVTHTSVGKPTSKGFSPPKFYSAVYVPPTATFLSEPDKGGEFDAPPAKPLTFEQAIAAYEKVGGTRDEFIANMKSKGLSNYNGARDAELVRLMIEDRRKHQPTKAGMDEDTIPFTHDAWIV